MNAASIVVTPENPGASDIRAMLAAADEYFRAIYPVEANHLLDVTTLQRANVIFITAREAGRLVGTGALVMNGAGDDSWGEIKRMFVDGGARGRGVARAILAALENFARGIGLEVLRLETGTKQTEAFALYRAAGFTDCGPFGGYGANPHNIFMQKRL